MKASIVELPWIAVGAIRREQVPVVERRASTRTRFEGILGADSQVVLGSVSTASANCRLIEYDGVDRGAPQRSHTYIASATPHLFSLTFQASPEAFSDLQHA